MKSRVMFCSLLVLAAVRIAAMHFSGVGPVQLAELRQGVERVAMHPQHQQNGAEHRRIQVTGDADSGYAR